jgi:hypothetical protein
MDTEPDFVDQFYENFGQHNICWIMLMKFKRLGMAKVFKKSLEYVGSVNCICVGNLCVLACLSLSYQSLIDCLCIIFET